MSYKGYTNIWWVSSILNEYASLMTEYQADGIEDIMGGTAKYLEQAIDKILKLPMNKELLKNEPDGKHKSGENEIHGKKSGKFFYEHRNFFRRKGNKNQKHRHTEIHKNRQYIRNIGQKNHKRVCPARKRACRKPYSFRL